MNVNAGYTCQEVKIRHLFMIGNECNRAVYPNCHKSIFRTDFEVCRGIHANRI